MQDDEGELRAQLELAMVWGADLARQAQLFRGALSGTMDSYLRTVDELREQLRKHDLAALDPRTCRPCRGYGHTTPCINCVEPVEQAETPRRAHLRLVDD